jgi:hypothetical protein
MDHEEEHNDNRTAGIQNTGYSEPSFLDALSHPHNVFADPKQVIEHPMFSDQEKRTILLSWVRDELVKEQVAVTSHSQIDAVIEALSRFDPPAAGECRSAVVSVRAARGGVKRTEAPQWRHSALAIGGSPRAGRDGGGSRT